MNSLLKSIIILSILVGVANAKQGVVFNVVEGNAESKYEHLVNRTLESIGYALSDPHERINDAYEVKYGVKTSPQYDPDWNKNLDNLGFFSVSNDVKLRSILLTNPEIGGFSPFNLHIYKKKSEDKTYVGHIMPETMLDIVGIEDKKVRDEFIFMFHSLDKLVQKEIGGVVEHSYYDSLYDDTMLNYEISFNRPEDLSDYIDEFQEEFEQAMENKNYIIAGFKNFKESYDDLDLEFDKYDEYFVYSLCHFTFSYNIFNKGRPDAGAFAPCSMYMYIDKGTNKLIIGMPRLSNWVSVLNIKDKIMIDSVHKLDKEITSIMISLGAKEI